MENTQTNQESYKPQQLVYSPPHQPTEETNEPSIPVQVPTLTPPHSSNTTAVQHKQQHQSPTKSTETVPFTTSQKQSSSTLPSTTLVKKPVDQRLPPRKRIQSLKKQYTKPNLSAPVIPVSLTTTTETYEAQSAANRAPGQPSSSISYKAFSHTDSRSPSPLVDIEDNSGETTETDDDDWQQHKTATLTESTLKDDDDDDDDDDFFKTTKHAIIINQQPTLPTPSPDGVPTLTPLNKTQKAKKPLKKHWDSSSLQSPSRGLDRQDEKAKKPQKKKGRSNSNDPIQPTKIRKTSSGGRPPKSRMKKSGALYCICQTPYDAPRFMIACDRCDQWFHGECIGISEKEGEFIDLYFCDVCGKETGKSTSWKSRCGNPACPKAARISSHQGYLSKYCSHDCGMQVARARLELTEMKKRQSTDDDRSIPQITLNKQRQSRLGSSAEKQDQHRLEQLGKQKSKALEVVRMIELKQHFIEMTAQQAAQSDLCGFDSRLVWDDPYWLQVKSIDATGPVLGSTDDDDIPPYRICEHGKKECRQHQHWQKILDLEMQQERKEQLQVIKRLEKEKQDVKNRMRTRRNQLDLVDALGNGTITY